MKAIVIFLSLLAGAFAFSDCFCGGEYDPVCGSNGKTYENMCEFECAKKQKPGMSLVGHMECENIIMEQHSCICTMEYNPVCGSDGKTYGNECAFRCAQRDNKELTLAYHDVCASSQNNEKHLCICTMEYSPVCGSDGKTYSNLCVFKCAQRDNSGLTLRGHDQCEFPLPQKPDACVCTREYKPVCGSDGLTYGNACELRCAMSKTPGLKFVKNRACEDDFIIRSSQYPCVCTREYDPVCGTDGMSYGNPCMLRCAMSQNPGLGFAKYGACEDDTPSYVDPCACTREFNPVCGSDGLTYGNPCMLRCAMSKKSGLRFVNYGECGRHFMLKLFGAPACACNKMMRPVCGSDGKTYSNPCLLNCAKKQNPALKLVKQGPCGMSLLQRETQPLCACDRTFVPVCGSDRITYNNLCIFECAQKRKPELTLLKEGHCYNYFFEKENDDCVCSSVRKPVCGSDLKTYDNLCQFECAAKKKPGLKVMYHMVCIIM